MTSRSESVFRTLLRAYPARTREESGEDMVQLFTDRLRDAGSRRERTAVWLDAIRDTVATAPRERLVAHRSTAQVAEGPIFYRPTKADLLWAAAPIAIALVLGVTRPGVLAPLFLDTVALAGLPLGVAMLILTSALASVGIFLSRRTDVGDPQVQFLAITCGLLPVPLLWFVLPIDLLALYAMGMTLFVLLVRLRIVTLAMAIPFLAWLLAGTTAVTAIVGIGHP